MNCGELEINFQNGMPTSSQEQIKKSLKVSKPQERTGILVKEGQGFVQIAIDERNMCGSEESITFGITEDKRSSLRNGSTNFSP